MAVLNKKIAYNVAKKCVFLDNHTHILKCKKQKVTSMSPPNANCARAAASGGAQPKLPGILGLVRAPAKRATLRNVPSTPNTRSTATFWI